MATRPVENEWETISTEGQNQGRRSDDWETINPVDTPQPSVNTPEEKTLAGFGSNLLTSGAKFAGDIGQGLMAAPGLAYQLGKEAFLPQYTEPVASKAIVEGVKGIPDYLAKRYGGSQQILDTLYKDPVGFAADLSTLLGAGGAAAKLGKFAELGTGLTKAAEIVDPIAQAGRAVRAPAAAAGRAMGLSERFYKSALKPSTAGGGGIERAREAVATGLREEIPINAAGESKVKSIIEDMKQKVAEKIAAIPPGTTVDPHDIAQVAEQVRPDFENVRASIDQPRITASKEAFLKRYEIPGEKLPGIPGEERLKELGINPDRFAPTTYKQLTPDEVQSLKQKSGTRLKGKYGSRKTPTVEAEKALTRGAKEVLEELAPGIDLFNERWSKLIGLETELKKAVERIGKHQVMGIGTPLAAGAGGAIGGPVGAGAFATVKLLLDDPVFKSKLALSINRAQKLKESSLTKLSTASRVTGGLNGPD